MSKYNLSDILNEYIGGGRIGTLKISFKDLQDKMDELEDSGKVIVRTLSGPSGDGKVNREFEVVDRDSAVPGGNKQERGFTVYDYKFGFDPGDEDNFMNEYPFSVGGNDLKLAMELIDGVEPYGINEENVIKDLAQADEVIKMIKMMNPDVRQDLLMRIARMGQKLNEGDLFSSKFDRQELKAIINDLNEEPIFDMAVRRAYKFLVSLLDREDKKEMGLNEQMYIDDDEFEMEMGRSKKDSLKKEMMIHVDQLIDGNIDMNDFMNVVEDVMAEVNSLKESTGPSDKAETEDDVVNIDKVAGPGAKGTGYGAETSANTAEDDQEDKEIENPRPMYENGHTSDYTSELSEEEMSDDEKKYTDTVAKMLKDRILKDIPMDIIIDFVKTHGSDIRTMNNSEIKDEFEEFRSVNYDYIDEDLKAHFNRFK
jgi:hypothetical protein